MPPTTTERLLSGYKKLFVVVYSYNENVKDATPTNHMKWGVSSIILVVLAII